MCGVFLTYKTAPFKNKNLHQVSAEYEDILFTIPWRHHIEIFTRSKSVEEALFFIQKTKENGWSRAMLINVMDTKLYKTRGKTLNNFSLTLPAKESECAKEILKDEYKLDFLTLKENYEEKDLHLLEVMFLWLLMVMNMNVTCFFII